METKNYEFFELVEAIKKSLQWNSSGYEIKVDETKRECHVSQKCFISEMVTLSVIDAIKNFENALFLIQPSDDNKIEILIYI